MSKGVHRPDKEKQKAKPYKRGDQVRKVTPVDPKSAPPGEKCAYCRGVLALPPRDIFSQVDKVVQLNRKEWTHWACYTINENPTKAYGFRYHDRSSGQWRKRG